MSLDKSTLDQIKSIIFRHFNPKTDKVFIYGSRASGTNRNFSDIDIGIKSKQKIPSEKIWKLKDDFEESDIPYIIDVTDFAKVSKSFSQIALQKTIPLN